jgi:hypothetical protein
VAGTPLVLQDAVSQASEVDHWTLTVGAGTVTIDVESWESCGNKPSVPMDLFGDGNSNNNLEANIYIFQQNGTLVAGCVGSGSSRTGVGAAVSCAGPGAHFTRSGHNPYISMSISAGTYIVAIGSADLSESDAWAGVNNDILHSYWTNFASFPAPGHVLYNKYKITITLTP